MLRVGWKTKAAIQGTLALLPRGKDWNQAIQRHLTKSLVLDREKFLTKLEFARVHVRNLAELEGVTKDFSVLEVGTGRFPIVPLYMFLRGAGQVVSLDIICLLRADTIRDTLRFYQAELKAGRIPEVLPERAACLLEVIHTSTPATTPQLLREFNIVTELCDARQTALPKHSFDLLVSNTTLEHIPGPILVEILRHWRELACPNAVMSHFIDMRDHYAEWDRSITVYNFLRYSKRRWRWFNNSLLYQNRLRISDYRRIHADAGWEIVFEQADPGWQDDLATIPLAEEFRDYSRDDLQVPTCWMVSRTGQKDLGAGAALRVFDEQVAR
ncbi:MAG TPA: class I SAM-dependent methyltransferase [Terriglobales bacterium]|nr:class I SAM-dependent methyltransferase [Terriglobales bacterium]